MVDKLDGFAPFSWESPARKAVEVTPSDSVELTFQSRGIYIGGTGGGALTVTMSDGNDVAFAGLVAGILLPIRATHVKATGTDVTSIVAMA